MRNQSVYDRIDYSLKSFAFQEQNKWLKENNIIYISGEEPISITKPFLALGVIFLVV